MYKGFFEDVEYVMGLLFRPFEECFRRDDDKEDAEEDAEEKKGGPGCDGMPCCREDDGEEDEEEKRAPGCDGLPCCREKDEEENKEETRGPGCDGLPCCREKDGEDDTSGHGGHMREEPLQEILRCLFDASDIDYDYED